MSGVMVSVATGVMTSVIEKLSSLLGNEYRLATDIRSGVRFMRDELSMMHAALQRLAEMDDDQIDVQTKEWRSKVRELSYDIEDCVDRFMLLHSSTKAKVNFVQRMKRNITDLWADRKIAREIHELKALVLEEKERRDRYNIDQYLAIPPMVALDPRAPAMYADAMDLVGIDGPCMEVIGLLMREETQLKVVALFGVGGQGKTTLAMEVYRKIEGQFDCHASVAVSQIPNINKVLRDLLFQINRTEYHNSERWKMEQLILMLREHLMEKRYLIIIDDIWKTSAWEHVKSALPINNNRSRIITTTRNRDVAKSCCSIIGGHMHEARPLSDDDSRNLVFRRTFGPGEACPQELQEVAHDILRKCGGLPLAIICIAGLLANKSQTVEVWVKIRKSVSSAIEKDSSVDKMRRILFLSYYDLPHYLMSCLQYLSVFPEDYEIDCRELIWIWVAEGLIPGYNRQSMEQRGESCLNELINRSLIQATKITTFGGTVKRCRVHDVILDFIMSKAEEDNFVAVWNSENIGGIFSYKNRRLSIHLDGGVDHFDNPMKNTSHIRSLNIFGSQNKWKTLYTGELRNNHVLRVVNIDSRIMLPLTEIASKKQLNYLSMTFTTEKLPEEIGKLQCLETLDLRNTKIEVLPESIVQLQKLVRLFVSPDCVLPDGIGNLNALEELSCCGFYKQSPKCIQGLVHLTKLRVLGFIVSSPFAEVKETYISSLYKLLMHLQDLSLLLWKAFDDPDFTLALMASHGWTPPLQKLKLLGCMLHAIPSGISSLVHLTHLKFDTGGPGVSKEGLNILASLPALLSLGLILCYDGDMNHPIKHVIGRQGFRRLVNFKIQTSNCVSLEFEAEAMPKVQRFKLVFLLSFPLKFGPGGIVLVLQNLFNLRYVKVGMGRATGLIDIEHKVAALKDCIRGQVAAHPNHPKLEFAG